MSVDVVFVVSVGVVVLVGVAVFVMLVVVAAFVVLVGVAVFVMVVVVNAGRDVLWRECVVVGGVSLISVVMSKSSVVKKSNKVLLSCCISCSCGEGTAELFCCSVNSSSSLVNLSKIVT